MNTQLEKAVLWLDHPETGDIEEDDNEYRNDKERSAERLV